MVDYLKETFESMSPNVEGFIDTKDVLSCFVQQGCDKKYKLMYGIVSQMNNFNRFVDFDTFKYFVSKHFDFIPSSSTIHQITDLNIINKYLHLSDIYAEGELLNNSHLKEIKNDLIENGFFLDKIDLLIECSQRNVNGILSYADFKRILS